MRIGWLNTTTKLNPQNEVSNDFKKYQFYHRKRRVIHEIQQFIMKYLLLLFLSFVILLPFAGATTNANANTNAQSSNLLWANNI